MPAGRGLPLARNDKAAASGLRTAARQRRSPAAHAPSGTSVHHVTLATLPASTARMCGWGGARCQPLSPTSRGAEALKQSSTPERRRRFPPAERQGPPRRTKVKIREATTRTSDGGVADRPLEAPDNGGRPSSACHGHWTDAVAPFEELPA